MSMCDIDIALHQCVCVCGSCKWILTWTFKNQLSDVCVCLYVSMCLYSTRIQNGAITLTVSDIDVLLQQSFKVSNGTMNLDLDLLDNSK